MWCTVPDVIRLQSRKQRSCQGTVVRSTSCQSSSARSLVAAGNARSVPSARSLRCSVFRRDVLTLVPVLLGYADPRTVVNSVLSAYGLPTLSKTAGYQLLDDFANNYVLEYPKSWVIRANTQRRGVYISDFQTADKAVVEVLPAGGDLDSDLRNAISAVVNPGDVFKGGGSDRAFLPNERSVKTERAVIEGREYTYMQFPSETLTNSGYNIKRRNFAVSARKADELYVLAASARSDQYNPEKAETLLHIVQSFRIR